MAVIGIDVSKKKLDCAWLRDPARGKVKTRVFANQRDGFIQMLDWLTQHTGEPIHDLQIVMEATGVYHEGLAYWLHDAGAQVSVVNPARIHAHAESLGVRSKTDKKDSVVLADYGHVRPLVPWVPEPANVRQLKALVARLGALDKDIQRETNRREKAEIADQPAVLASIDDVLRSLREAREAVRRQIEDHIDMHPDLKQDRALLQTIPGIGAAVSLRLITLLRSRTFDSGRQAAAFAGLVPIHRQSGSSVNGRSKLSKAGDARLRQRLYMAAVVATQHNPDMIALKQRLRARGKHSMAIIGAVMRKLIHIAYGVLKTQTVYQPQAA